MIWRNEKRWINIQNVKLFEKLDYKIDRPDHDANTQSRMQFSSIGNVYVYHKVMRHTHAISMNSDANRHRTNGVKVGVGWRVVVCSSIQHYDLTHTTQLVCTTWINNVRDRRVGISIEANTLGGWLFERGVADSSIKRERYIEGRMCARKGWIVGEWLTVHEHSEQEAWARSDRWKMRNPVVLMGGHQVPQLVDRAGNGWWALNK